MPEEDNEQNEGEEIKQIDRSNLSLQQFFNDMQSLGNQVNSNDIKKPTFFYGDISVTNYLLWLLIGELQILNNKGGVE